ncbi:CD48 antigen-like [Terrapene carolina triunguis]|uniref:CD48 antigen-like n=1 Tax=Terrapene triunguis TaxID=2587831 RepID=UPI000CEF81DC|nr:CD48 antigen-like [Terrapene carolina triunguis]
MLGKMAAAVATFACLVVLSSLQAYEATAVPRSQVNGTICGTVYLNPKLSVPEKYQQIIWWFNESLKILTKKWNQPVYYPGGNIHNKLRYHENHTLEINQLQKQDSGTYRMEVEDSQSKKTNELFRLDVYEPVPKPRMNFTIRANEDGWCNVTLACIVDATQVTYHWRKNEKDLVGKISSTLDVALKSESHASYKCSVSNPASEETGFFNYRSPCTWNEKNSAVPVSLARKTADSILAFGFLLLVHNWV